MTTPVGLVVRREVRERLRAKSFLISTGIYLLVALASVVIPHFATAGSTVYGIAVTGLQAAALDQAISEQAGAVDLDVSASSSSPTPPQPGPRSRTAR